MSLDLLHFQSEDVEKLKSKRARLVGNDPGTGKTYEGIALDLCNRSGDGNPKVADIVADWKVKKTLIVCPKNALAVWDDHLMELTDDDIYLYTYNTRHKFMQQVRDPRRGGYFIVNYDSLRIKDMEGMKKIEFFHIIGDEIHRIKNRKAQLTRAFKQLQALYKTGMSGTPADNKPEDLWSILNWLWPNYYTAFNRFVNTYTIRVEMDPNSTGQVAYTDSDGIEHGYKKVVALNEATLPILHKEMEPWFVRRLKEDVLPDLPDKYYARMWVELGPKQRAAYEQMKKTMIIWFEERAEELEAGNPLIAQAAVAQLSRLQQLTAGYLVPLLDENGVQKQKFVHKKHKAGEECSELCDWQLQWTMDDPSAKLDAVMELLEDRGDEPVIIFSQSKAAIKLLGKRLARKGIPYGLYTGDTKQKDRDQLVRDFQSGDVRVFAGTIKAGGEAITLTRASTVIFIDRWWSQSKNVQAEDRAHRIGQINAVEVIDIMARNTVDLGRHQTIMKKWDWCRQLLGDKVDTVRLIKELDLSQTIEVDQEEE